MPDILHKLTIAAPKDRVFRALATREGLASWWTTTTSGDSAPGQTLAFNFNQHVVEMRVGDLEPGARVTWGCVKADAEWVGTNVTFDLGEVNGRTTVTFGHRDWASTSESFAHCSTKWATFLLSLREYVETGKGRPFPRSVDFLNKKDQQLDQVFHGLANPSRRKMVALLREAGQMKVGDIAQAFAMTLDGVSKHLKVLEQAGLVTRRVEGRVHWISVNWSALQPAYEFLHFHQQFWATRLDALVDHIDAKKKR